MKNLKAGDKLYHDGGVYLVRGVSYRSYGDGRIEDLKVELEPKKKEEKMSVKEITKYVTETGKEFETKEEAIIGHNSMKIYEFFNENTLVRCDDIALRKDELIKLLQELA
jgi:hypothetical protein